VATLSAVRTLPAAAIPPAGGFSGSVTSSRVHELLLAVQEGLG
jgi:hypothetical protein